MERRRRWRCWKLVLAGLRQTVLTIDMDLLAVAPVDRRMDGFIMDVWTGM